MIAVVGAGKIGKELLSKLSRDFDIVCIDKDPQSRETIKQLRAAEKTMVIIGDATSRLVLEEAKVDESEAVIITTTEERVNLEVARVLHEHFSARRVISVCITEKGMEELVGLGAEVQNIFTASANDIRNLIEHQAKTAYGIGLGKNEILEVEVHANSKLKNRPLGSIAPIRWSVGMIYRDGNIVIPREDTVLKEKDRVVILGDPSVLRTVSELLTSDFQRFPIEFGTSLVAYISGQEDEGIYAEINYVYSVFQLSRVHIVYSSGAEDLFSEHDNLVDRHGFTAGKTTSLLGPVEALRAFSAAESLRPAMVILSKRIFVDSTLPFYARTKKNTISSLIQTLRCPVLLSAGTFPYERIAVPCIEGTKVRRPLETAVEISRTINTQLEAVLVKPSEYIAAEGDVRAFEEARQVISNVGFLHKRKIPIRVLEGNPVQSISAVMTDYNLLLLGTEGWSGKGLIRNLIFPDVAWQILPRSALSTLLLPKVEESL